MPYMAIAQILKLFFSESIQEIPMKFYTLGLTRYQIPLTHVDWSKKHGLQWVGHTSLYSVEQHDGPLVYLFIGCGRN